MFEGVHTAIITPFKNGSVDIESLEKIIEMQIEGGIDGIVPAGSTGESSTISFDEHERLIHEVVRIVRGRVKVIAGTGANSTSEAVHLSKSAADAGVDGVLQVNPYYNKPTQNGLIAHFEKVANSVPVPVVLYNIPGRTSVNFLPESVNELLGRTDNIAAMKEASGDINQMMRLIELCGNKISVLSGDDNLFLPLLSVGGNGLISVLSNMLPFDLKRIYTLFVSGKFSEARDRFYKLLPLCRAVFIETNPIPIKAVMSMAGYCGDEMRLPLLPLDAGKRDEIRKLFNERGVKL
ncbi:MAG: 4-hydroxy-tetrahydrodipicolinate synthase [Spirochaetia bacterium]|jgi:4-hydroxy-tetrahydrodipicolinate synthase|nr:4-hydroxy-tetrahydrodipicolinate synthase [Spirochaetia bacterium]